MRQVEVRLPTHFSIEPLFSSSAGDTVRFLVHPFSSESGQMVQCEAPIKTMRQVRSSNGKKENRFIIETTLNIGPIEKNIELSLTDRSLMRFNLLLGREALTHFAIIDPDKKYLLGLIK